LFEAIERGAHWKQAIEASQNWMSKLGMDGFKNPLPCRIIQLEILVIPAGIEPAFTT
jgi:hypothetical protein